MRSSSAVSDFHQSGVFSTLHRLGRPDLQRLERELSNHARSRPIALVLPCLHSELRDVALKGIIEQLQHLARHHGDVAQR